MTLDQDTLHRGVKLEMDFGDAKSLKDAERIVRGYVLQIRAGSGVAHSRTRQAALLTAVNAGSRAFLGGVHVQLDEDFSFTTPWDQDRSVKDTLSDFDNVTFVQELDPNRPVIIIGEADWNGGLPLYTTWEGWAAGVVIKPLDRLAEETEFALTGVLSGALAVSEAFQWTRGYHVAAAREVGLSLWAPDQNWRLPDASGPALKYLPANYWLLGLGHLGQAYAWALGFLPFPIAKRDQISIMLQDFDAIADANEATSMLVRNHARGLKTHVVARELQRLGLTPRITDRRFDKHTHPNQEEPAEPRLALGGFDNLQPRRLLDGTGFSYVVDAGIGVGRNEYLGIEIHTFPSSRTANDVFPEESDVRPNDKLLDRDAYRVAAEHAVQTGEATTLDAARCGLIDIAGKAAGAAFVGSVAATIALSELLRIVNGGAQYETITLNLRAPGNVSAYRNPEQRTIRNPGFVQADQSGLTAG
jgi:hypothetical protein